MRPAPREKPPQTSPIFISDKVTLHVSREKGGKLCLGYAGMGRSEGRSAGWLRASSWGGRVKSYPLAGGAMTPPRRSASDIVGVVLYSTVVLLVMLLWVYVPA
jgi:hypothetical protein